PGIVGTGRRLSDTTGTVLDPIFAIRHRLRVPPGESSYISFWTLVAETREGLMDLIDKHHDRSAFERARTLAWTQAQVQLRHLGMRVEEAATVQRLAAALLYSDARFRPSSHSVVEGADRQSAL